MLDILKEQVSLSVYYALLATFENICEYLRTEMALYGAYQGSSYK